MLRLGLPLTLSFSACVVRTILFHGQWVQRRLEHINVCLRGLGQIPVPVHQIRRQAAQIRRTLLLLLFEDVGQSSRLGPMLRHWSPGGRTAMLGSHPGDLLLPWAHLLFTSANGYMAASIVAARPWVPNP